MMGRTRKTDRDMPARVYRHGQWWRFVPPQGIPVKLGRTKAEALRAYADLMGLAGTLTIADLFDRYLREVVPGKAPRTQKDNAVEMVKLRSVFGHMSPAGLRRSHVRQYLDIRAQQGAAVRGNREKALLSHVYSWAMERDLIEVVVNPCKGVHRNPEKAVETYVTDEQYQAAYARATERMQIFMELAYLLAARKSEVLDLMRFDLSEDGVRVRRGKGSKTNIVRWSQRLEDAVNRALALPGRSEYLLHDRHGVKIKASSLDTAWQRLRAGFRLHDLKAKGVSDSSAANPAGHRSVSMIAAYRRKPEKVEPPK